MPRLQFVPDEAAEDADAQRYQLESCVCVCFHERLCRRCEIALVRLAALIHAWPFLAQVEHYASLASSSLCGR